MSTVAVAPVLAVYPQPGEVRQHGEAAGESEAGAGRRRPSTDDLPAAARAALRQASVALDALVAMDPDALGGRGTDQLALALHGLAERAAAGATALLPRVERDGRWALDGDATFPRWVATRFGSSVAGARVRVRTARVLADHLPAVLDAALAGDLGTESAGVLARAATTATRRAVLADESHGCNATFLLDQARSLGVDDLRAVVRVWAAHADPSADERGFVEASEREFLTLARLPYGYRLDGQLTVEHGQQLGAALAAVSSVPAADDQRSSAQRRAQALADLARSVLEHHPVPTGRVARPQVAVHVDLETLQAEVARADAARDGTEATGPARFTPTDLRRGAFFADGTSVPPGALDRLACDSGLFRILFAPDGEVLDVGRTKRIFSGAVRTAVVARDGHCAYPGCSAPPSISEVHHVAHWTRDGGRTEPRNGVLLCYHHHEVVHRRGLSVARDGRRWAFADRAGVPLRQ